MTEHQWGEQSAEGTTCEDQQKRELREKEGKGLEPFLATLFFSVKKKKEEKKPTYLYNLKLARVEITHGNVLTSCRQITNATF